MLTTLAAGVSTLYWAQEAPADTGNTLVDALLKGGPFAVVLALIILDKLGTNSERDRLREENKALREANQELNDSIRSEIVGPITEQNRLMGEVLRVLDDEERYPQQGRRRPAPRRDQ